MIERPIRNEVLHRDGIIAHAEPHFFIELICFFDFYEVRLDAEPRNS